MGSVTRATCNDDDDDDDDDIDADTPLKILSHSVHDDY
jgi:hypothetical protein